MPRKKYAGGAVATKLNGPINNATTTVVLVDASTYPSGADPFVIAVDRGTASEEKMLCTRLAGSNTVTATRAYDGTTGVAHNDQALVEHVLDALSIDEANQFANTMTANGDLLTRSGGNPAAVAVGSAGQVLAVASGLPAWRDLTPGNILINGNFTCWQRGTSFTVGAALPYTADRWQAARSALATGMTVSRVSGPTGSLYALRMQRDSGNTLTQPMYLAQSMETVDSVALQGKTVALSFSAGSLTNYSATGRLLSVELRCGTGTDQNCLSPGFTGATTPIGTSVTLPTNSYQRFTLTGVVPSNCTQVGVFFTWTPTGTAGAADAVDIANVQLEVGSAATPFVARPFQQELAMCQRYYWAGDAHGTVPANGRAVFQGVLPRMRITPTVTCATITNGETGAVLLTAPGITVIAGTGLYAGAFGALTVDTWVVMNTIAASAEF